MPLISGLVTSFEIADSDGGETVLARRLRPSILARDQTTGPSSVKLVRVIPRLG